MAPPVTLHSWKGRKRRPYKDVTVPLKAEPVEVEARLTPTLQKALQAASALCKLARAGKQPSAPPASTPGIPIP